MTETQQPEKVTWGGIITFNFAPEFGSCLDELEDEYDDLITEFETQQQACDIVALCLLCLSKQDKTIMQHAKPSENDRCIAMLFYKSLRCLTSLR